MSPRPDEDELSALSDEQLVEHYQQGRSAAFEVLLHRYRHELLNFLTRFLGKRAVAEDIFQETFLQVHLSADTFDLDRRFKPWLFTIAANKGRDHMRRRARRPVAPLDAPIGGRGSDDGQSFVDILQDDLPLPGEAVEQAEQAERVQRTVDEMPEHLREILLLAYFQRFSYKQITEVLEIPLGTVKSRLHSAVGAFAKLWKQQNPARERT